MNINERQGYVPGRPDMQHIGYMSGCAKCFILGKCFISRDALFWDCSNILQNEKPQRRSNSLNSRTHGSSTNSLIFMRRYEFTDFLGFSNNIL